MRMGKKGLAILERMLREKSSHSKGEREQLCGEKRRAWVNRSVFKLPSKGSPILGNPKPTIQIDCEPN